MDYHILKKYRYTNRNQFESIYSSRYKNELALHYDFEIHGFPCFSLPTTEILNLTSRIYKLTQTLIYLKSKLPQIALEQYTQTCLVDEVKLTNEIEGVNSTRREIQDILNTQSITKKNMRLYGLVQKYNLLKNSEKISIHNCSDIRNIYNELVSEEIKNNDPLNLPDGIFFRRKSVSVYNSHMKEIHRGISGETEIIACMEKALFILHNKSIPPLIRISVFHYLFGYIHPFYDGNGRTNRFISSYLLSKELEPLISYHLAKTIKQNISKYYKSFDYTNDTDNRGDLTGFITNFLEIILASIEALIDSLEDNIDVDAADSVRRPRTYQAVRSDGQQDQRRGHAEGNIAPYVALGEGQRPDQGADAEDQKDVEEVRADDVSDRHVAVARRGREYRDDQFGRRGAYGDDRQADDEFRNPEALRDGGRAVRQEICAGENQSQSDDQQQNVHNLCKQNQADGHERHAGHHAVNRNVSFAVFAGCGQQFVDRDEDHDARDSGQYAAHQRRRHEGHQHQIGQQCADRLGEPRQQREFERLFAVARGVEDRNRDRNAFGNVVDGDRHGDCHAQRHVVHGRREGGDTFREVVDADGQRRHHAHAHQFGVAGLFVHLLDHVGLVGVLERGN